MGVFVDRDHCVSVGVAAREKRFASSLCAKAAGVFHFVSEAISRFPPGTT